MNWLEIVKVVGPIILALIPELSKLHQHTITTAIVAAEVAGGTSDQKLANVLSTPELAGHETSAIVAGVNATIAIANAVHAAALAKDGQ